MENIYINNQYFDVLKFDFNETYKSTQMMFNHTIMKGPRIDKIELNICLEQNETNYISMFSLYDNRQKVDILCGNKILYGCYITTINSILDCDNNGVIDTTFNVDYMQENYNEEYMNVITNTALYILISVLFQKLLKIYQRLKLRISCSVSFEIGFNISISIT